LTDSCFFKVGKRGILTFFLCLFIEQVTVAPNNWSKLGFGLKEEYGWDDGVNKFADKPLMKKIFSLNGLLPAPSVLRPLLTQVDFAAIYVTIIWNPIEKDYSFYVGMMSSATRWEVCDSKTRATHHRDIAAFLNLDSETCTISDAAMACSILNFYTPKEGMDGPEWEKGVFLMIVEKCIFDKALKAPQVTDALKSREIHWVKQLESVPGMLNKLKNSKHKCACEDCKNLVAKPL
jgi:hypothetical protein